jgi:hypothetical protein
VFLPLDQPNLDFQMVDALPEQTPKHVLLGHVILNPVKAGFVATSIKLKVATMEPFNETNELDLTDNYGEEEPEEEKECNENGNSTVFVEIPILGSVVDFPNMLSAVDLSSAKRQQDFDVIHPLYLMDPNQAINLKKHEHIPPEKTFVLAPLMIKNNLNDDIRIKRIYDREHLDEATPEYQNRIFELVHDKSYEPFN